MVHSPALGEEPRTVLHEALNTLMVAGAAELKFKNKSSSPAGPCNERPFVSKGAPWRDDMIKASSGKRHVQQTLRTSTGTPR